MSEKLKPCHCGFSGAITVEKLVIYEAECPSCGRQVSAFTVAGLLEAWNKDPQQPAEGE